METATRKSNSRKVKLHADAEAVATFRESNVPYRVIARTLNLTERNCRELARTYYRRAVALDRDDAQVRIAERRQQLEALDARLMRIVASGPDAALLAKGGYELREWLAAAEASRRVKSDLIRLEGLVREFGAGKLGGVTDGAPPQTVKELRSEAVQEFLIRMLQGQPREFRDAVTSRIADIIGEGVDGVGQSPRVVESGGGGPRPAGHPVDIPLSEEPPDDAGG